jgi:streptomycin 3"-adenylyltransferase
MARSDGTLTIASVHHFADELAGELADVAADAVVGVYVHGSAVLGDWLPGRSDVDLLIVVTDALPNGVAKQLAAVLAAERDCPGTGVEASVVAAGAASVPRAPYPFIVHITTAPHDRKTVFGVADAGDADLILHYAVTRDAGWSALGPRPETVVGAIPDHVVLTQLAAELRWAVTHADESYAVLNACRALRYREEGVLCSKSDGGAWALSREIEPALVRHALEDRRRGLAAAVTAHAAEWTLTIAAEIRP